VDYCRQFNTIIHPDEKQGGFYRIDAALSALVKMISSLSLVDIALQNSLFSWNKRRGGAHRIVERLDPFQLKEHLLNLSISPESYTLSRVGSDHWPIVMFLQRNNQSQKTLFWFEMM
jgi:hypothetical protein